jgi:putative Mg2+ transporter-C (MgtC) family protein
VTAEYWDISVRLLAALGLGGLIGLERSYRGRAAGFRTHALVCLASCLLMLVGVYGGEWFPIESATLDPTRVAQGIMTGIGFLGAGAILKDGLTVSGLTTAATIWVTAVVGILAGVGFHAIAGLGTLLTLATLIVFARFEKWMVTESHTLLAVRFDRDAAMQESTLRALIAEHGFTARQVGYRVTDDGGQFEYSMVVQTLRTQNLARLADTLRRDDAVRAFRIDPASE